MPTLEFVQNCIGSPLNKIQSHFIYFNFGLQVGNELSMFAVFKDLDGVNNATRTYLLNTYPKSEILEINRLSNDSYYNLILQIFKIDDNKEIECFVFKEWSERYGHHFENFYFFNFDDFPNVNKGRFVLSDSEYYSFINKFFKGHSWFTNNYMSLTDSRNMITVYTTIFGSSPTCTPIDIKSQVFWSNNCGCAIIPFSVRYSIHNSHDPKEGFIYETDFSDIRSVSRIVYYLTLDNFSFGTCCLAECFGITE